MPNPEAETPEAVAADQYYLTTLHPARLQYYELCDRTRAYADNPAAGPRLSRAYHELKRRQQGGLPHGPIEPAPPAKIVPPPTALSAAAGVLY